MERLCYRAQTLTLQIGGETAYVQEQKSWSVKLQTVGMRRFTWKVGMQISDQKILGHFNGMGCLLMKIKDRCFTLTNTDTLDIQKHGVQGHADIDIAEAVMRTGKFNFQEARIPIHTNWNTDLMESLLVDYEDKQVTEFLKYGWPISIAMKHALCHK